MPPPTAKASPLIGAVERYLRALGCRLTAVSADAYSVELPSWRLDLEREIDLVEEVARVYGYNRFANTLPGFAGAVVEQPYAQQEGLLRDTLRALGFTEAISSTFTSAEEAATFSDGGVAIGNPLNAEAGMLRPALAPGMATMLANNLHRDVGMVRLFELGTVFTGSTQAVAEHTGLALGATGAAVPGALYRAEDALFYEMKGALEALTSRFAGEFSFDTEALPAWIAAGRGARLLLDAMPLAVFGELSGAELHARKLRRPVVLAELHAATLLARPLRQPVVQELSRFQAVSRDFSFVFPDAVAWGSIAAAVRDAQLEELRSVEPVEIFRDAKGRTVPAAHYSLLLRVVFQSAERTLTEEEISTWTAAVISRLVSLGGTQRV